MNSIQKIALGAVGSALALTLAVGGVTAFAADSEAATVPGTVQDVATLATGTYEKTGHFGGGRGGAGDEYLAEALGISVEELEAARLEAQAAYLEDAVAAGDITQEEADLIQARTIVGTYVDKEALAAETEEMSRADAMAAHRAAYEAAVAEALADGAITQAQADTLLAQPTGRGMGGGRGGRFGGMPQAPTTESAPEAGL